MSGGRIAVDIGPWEIISDEFTELCREYDFVNLRGPDTRTKIELRCRLIVEQEGAPLFSFGKSVTRKKLRPFVYLVIDPYLLEKTSFYAAIFAPSDDLVNHKVLTAKIEAAATGVNFIVFDISDGEKLLNVLMLGRQITLRLIDPSKESIAFVPLENDETFRIKYEELSSSLQANGERSGSKRGNQIDRWNALVRYDDEIRAAAEKLRPFGEPWVNKLGHDYFALDEDRTYLPKIVGRLIEEAKLDHAQRWADRFRQTAAGELCSDESLRILREAEARGYTLVIKENKVFSVTKTGKGTSYLWSNSDMRRFGRTFLSSEATEF